MYPIPSVEEFEKDIEGAETEIATVNRWSLASPDNVREQIKKPLEVKPILRWTPVTHIRPSIVHFVAGMGKSNLVGNFLSESLIEDEKILGFKGAPDEENFVPCTRETLDRAKTFLSGYAAVILGGSLVPKVLPGPAGSIDIHWKSEKKELLVNIPADPNLPATFYGDDYGDIFIKGSARIGKPDATLAYWLLFNF